MPIGPEILFQINRGPVSWRSKKQSSVALSTAEAEYIALTCSSQEAIWLKQLTTELGNASSKSITIYEDIQANGMLKLEYCPTKDMVADMLTKGLSHK